MHDDSSTTSAGALRTCITIVQLTTCLHTTSLKSHNYFVKGGRVDHSSAHLNDRPRGAASVLNCLARQRVYGEHIDERDQDSRVDSIHRYHTHLLMLAILYACAGKIPVSTVRFLWDENIVQRPWQYGNWKANTVTVWSVDVLRHTEDDLSAIWDHLHHSPYKALGAHLHSSQGVITPANAPWFDIQSRQDIDNCGNVPRLKQAAAFLETTEHAWLRCLALCVRGRATIAQKPRTVDLKAPAMLRRMAGASELQLLYKEKYEDLASALEEGVEFRRLMEFCESAPSDILGVLRGFLVEDDVLDVAVARCLADLQRSFAEHFEHLDLRNTLNCALAQPWRSLAGFRGYCNEDFIGFWSAAPKEWALGKEIERVLKAPFVDFGISEHSLVLGIGISSALGGGCDHPVAASASGSGAARGVPPGAADARRSALMIEFLRGYCGVPPDQVFFEHGTYGSSSSSPGNDPGSSSSSAHQAAAPASGEEFSRFESAVLRATKVRLKERGHSTWISFLEELGPDAGKSKSKESVRNHFIVLGPGCVLHEGVGSELAKARQALTDLRAAASTGDFINVEKVKVLNEKVTEICRAFVHNTVSIARPKGLDAVLQRSSQLVAAHNAKIESALQSPAHSSSASAQELPHNSNGTVVHNVFVVTELQFVLRLQDYRRREQDEPEDFLGRLPFDSTSSRGLDSRVLAERLDAALSAHIGGRANYPIMGQEECRTLLEAEASEAWSWLEYQLVTAGLLRLRLREFESGDQDQLSGRLDEENAEQMGHAAPIKAQAVRYHLINLS